MVDGEEDERCADHSRSGGRGTQGGADFAGDMSWLPERLASTRAVIRRGVRIRALLHDLDTKEARDNAMLARGG
jgi:hypothetical protein